MPTVYVDTNIFLNPVLYDIMVNEEARKSSVFLKKVGSKKINAITSVLTWDEFTWIIKRELGTEVSIEKGNVFLIFLNFKFKNVILKTVKLAQELLSKYGIRPRDSIHCASAIENGIKTIISFDDDFDDVKEIERIEPLL